MRTRDLAVLALLTAVTVWAFWPVTSHPFINMDDETYVAANAHVRGGLSPGNVRWAFTNVGYASNWHPLTWLSHQLDATLFGLDPGRHHLTNLVLHALSVSLLFVALRLATGAAGLSAFVAALFAVHPLHVESVAWVAERKDVLSGLFWMLTLLAYLAYARRPTGARYAAVVAAFALGLLAKPMLVSLPLVLLLLDVWPLRRAGWPGPNTLNTVSRLILEKAPLFILAAASAAMTYVAQDRGGGLGMGRQHALEARLGNAVVALARYLGKMFFPVDLSVHYPFRGDLPAWQVAAASILTVALTGVCLIAARRRPWLLAGWFWFLVAILPVLGIVGIGSHALADRYSYVPFIGLFVGVTWEVRHQARRLFRRPGALLAVPAAAVIVASAAAARHQLGFWKESESLFRRAVAVTSDNWLAENNLGMALLASRPAEAIEHFRRAIQILPEHVGARINIGSALSAMGKDADALPWFDEALRLDPANDRAWFGRGIARLNLRQIEAAVADFRRTIGLRPGFAEAHSNLGAALLDLGRTEEAGARLREALRLDATLVPPRLNLGLLLFREGKLDEAALRYRDALRLEPGWPEAHFMLGLIAEGGGRTDEAAAEYREALRLRPGYADARLRLERLHRPLQGPMK